MIFNLISCLSLFFLAHIKFVIADDEFTYCIDEDALRIFTPRIQTCIDNNDIMNELEFLKNTNREEYQRGTYEILAYKYFTKENNPMRKSCSDNNIDFEYNNMIHNCN